MAGKKRTGRTESEILAPPKLEGPFIQAVTVADVERIERESRDGKGWPMVRLVDGRSFRYDDLGIIHAGRITPISSPPKLEGPFAESADAIVGFIMENCLRSLTKNTWTFNSYQLKHVFESQFGYCSCGLFIEAAERRGLSMRLDEGRDKRSPLLPVSQAWIAKYERDRRKLEDFRRYQRDWQEIEAKEGLVSLGSK